VRERVELGHFRRIGLRVHGGRFLDDREVQEYIGARVSRVSLEAIGGQGV
jgi:hypothetical protein